MWTLNDTTMAGVVYCRYPQPIRTDHLAPIKAGGCVLIGWVGGGAHGNAARQVVDGLRTEVWGQQQQSNDPRHIQHSPSTPTTGLRERGNDTSRSTGRSGRQNAATRRNMRRKERVTVQGPVKKQASTSLPLYSVIGSVAGPEHSREVVVVPLWEGPAHYHGSH